MYADVYDEVNYCMTPVYHGHSPDILVSSFADTIRTDISLADRHIIKIWGQLKTAKQLPLYKAIVRLIQLHCLDGHVRCIQIAETLTDPSGFYFFDVMIESSYCYRIVVCSHHPQDNKILIPHFSRCNLSHLNPDHCREELLSQIFQIKGGSR